MTGYEADAEGQILGRINELIRQEKDTRSDTAKPARGSSRSSSAGSPASALAVSTRR